MTAVTDIHPSAQVAPGAELGRGVTVGPYSVIGPDVRIGDGTRIGPLVVIDGRTTIGEDNHIMGQASIGGPPQDLSYRDEPTLVRIGDRNTVREFVTINRGTVKGGGLTSIGSDNMIMACCHVAHDCELADHIVLSNGSGLAGHVKVESHANVSGMVGAVHFVTIGEYAFVGRMFANKLRVLRIVTLTLLNPLPCGVVIGPFRRQFVSRNRSHASSGTPEVWPLR